VTRVVGIEGVAATESAVDEQHALAFSHTSNASNASQKSKSAVSEQHALALIALSRTLGGGGRGGGHALVGGGRELQHCSPDSHVGQRGSGATEIDRYKSTCWLVQKSACLPVVALLRSKRSRRVRETYESSGGTDGAREQAYRTQSPCDPPHTPQMQQLSWGGVGWGGEMGGLEGYAGGMMRTATPTLSVHLLAYYIARWFKV
jgi:hypothetical protein